MKEGRLGWGNCETHSGVKRHIFISDFFHLPDGQKTLGSRKFNETKERYKYLCKKYKVRGYRVELFTNTIMTPMITMKMCLTKQQ